MQNPDDVHSRCLLAIAVPQCPLRTGPLTQTTFQKTVPANSTVLIKIPSNPAAHNRSNRGIEGGAALHLFNRVACSQSRRRR